MTPMGRDLGAVMVLAAALAFPGRALAQPEAPRAVLVYERTDAAGACPGDALVRSLVAARLGADPFGDEAPVRVMVQVDRGAAGYRASIRIEAGGQVRGSRALRADRDCEALARAIALSVSLLLEVLDAPAPAPDRQAPAVEPEEAAAEPEAAVRAQAPDAEIPPPAIVSPPAPLLLVDRAPERRRATAGELAVSAGGQAGLLPAAGSIIGIQGRIRRGQRSLAIEGRWALPASDALAGGRVTASLLSGTVGACASFRQIGACALASGGALYGHGDGFDSSSTALAPYAAAGGRLYWEQAMTTGLALRTQVEVSASLVRTRLRVTGMPTGEWTAPPAAVGVEMALVRRFE